MPLLVACRCLSGLMRHCFQGRWTFQLVSEIYRLVWKCQRNTPQSSSYMATYHSARKLSKLDEPDMQDTAGEVGTSSYVMYSYCPLHLAEQNQSYQLEPTYSSSVWIWGIALRTCWKRWTIGRGGERGSEISVLMAWQDYDDDDGDEIVQNE